jgi:hypothetical protein
MPCRSPREQYQSVLRFIRLDLTLVHPVADPQAVAAIQEHTNACDGDGPATSQRPQPGGIHAFLLRSGRLATPVVPVKEVSTLSLLATSASSKSLGTRDRADRTGSALGQGSPRRWRSWSEARPRSWWSTAWTAWLVTSFSRRPSWPGCPARGGGALGQRARRRQRRPRRECSCARSSTPSPSTNGR